MSLKMATLCLDTSLETFRPLCRHSTLHHQGDLCRCLHEESPQALQAVVMLSARRVHQNSPQFIVQSYDICTPHKSILGAGEGQNVPPQPLLSCPGLLCRI